MLLGPWWVSGVWRNDGPVPLGPLNGRDISASKVTNVTRLLPEKNINNNIINNKSNDSEQNLRIKNQKQEQWQERSEAEEHFGDFPPRVVPSADPSFHGTRGGLCFSSPHSPRGAEPGRCHSWCPVVCGRLWDLGKDMERLWFDVQSEA